jgi:hypothetical protein
MKTYIKFLLLIMTVALTSCDRSGEWEDFQKDIPWSFVVVAVTDANNTAFAEGATVEVYKTQADRDAGTNIYLTGTTDAKGEATFSFNDFNKNQQGVDAIKGIYYLKVYKGALTANATTRYLLMNSGATTQWVQIK